MRHYAGFTLIELLVVIAILFILVSIALPNFLSARQMAIEVKCKANLNALGKGLLMYKLDHGAFPLADGCAGDEPSMGKTCAGSGPAAMGSWDGVPWILEEMKYVEGRETFYCPALVGRFPDKKQFLRYAYNSSAVDTGGANGGASNLERDSGHLWLCRCAWLPAEATFDRRSGLVYPSGHDPSTGEKDVMENVLRINGVVETVNGRRDYLNQMTHARRSVKLP